MSGQSPLDDFKTALSSVARAVTRDAEVEVGFTADAPVQIGKTIKVPTIHVDKPGTPPANSAAPQ